MPSPLAILSNVLTQVAAEYSRENMLRSDWVPRRIQYVAAPTMDAMYRKVMDRNNQWASNTDPEAMIVLRERLRAVVPVTSPARRVASAGRGGGAAAAGVASTVSDAADQTNLRATFVRHNSRKLPAYATIVCDVCIQGDLTVSHATSQRWSNLAKLGSALPPGMHKTTPSPSDAFFDLQKASFT